jgi:hypothetical protein
LVVNDGPTKQKVQIILVCSRKSTLCDEFVSYAQKERDAEDDSSRHDKLLRIKECHPDLQVNPEVYSH